MIRRSFLETETLLFHICLPLFHPKVIDPLPYISLCKPNFIKMGTRGLLGFIILGQRHAAYNHWDSYPDCLGMDIVKFISSLTPEDYATMAHLVAGITWVDSESKPSPELQERYRDLGFSDTRVSNQSLEDWYCLLRKTQGAAALPAIQSGALKHMAESRKFSTVIRPSFLAVDFTDSLQRW